MSYILDALKKSQAEQNPDAIAVSMGQASSRSRWTPTLLAVIAVLLVVNTAFFGYQLFKPGKDQETAEPDLQNTAKPTQVVAEEVSPVANLSDEPNPATVETVAPAIESIPDPVVQQPRRPVVIQQLSVEELPASEQVLYNSLNFTSHIYTDDPSECAIVVDGFRLTAGDGFKGLNVVEITEDGVVFSERRRNVERHVSISILDRWAAEG